MGRASSGIVLVGAAVVATIAACSGARPDSGALPGSTRTTSIERPADLPVPCFRFLSELECWLDKGDNDPAEVRRALAVARGVFEAHGPRDAGDDIATYCGRAVAYRRPLFQASGCDHVVASSSLPPAQPLPCPSDEHFFVRRDAHVSGCHPDCATDPDCPQGSTCKSIGTAAGGPIDEPFCE